MPGGKDVMPGGAPRGTAARDGEMGLCVAGTAPACTDDSSSTPPAASAGERVTPVERAAPDVSARPATTAALSLVRVRVRP